MALITVKVHTEVSSPMYVEDMKAYRFQKRSADTIVRLKDRSNYGNWRFDWQ